VPIFSGVCNSVAEQDRFTDTVGAALVAVNAPPESLIIRSGDEAPDAMFFVVSGEVVVRLPGGRQLKVLGPGDFFGEMGLLLGAPRCADVATVGHVELLRLARPELERAVEAHPALAAKLHREVTRRRQEMAKPLPTVPKLEVDVP
jgi:CRP/FNR family cyclic AMP-dependent transcriptional regulator